MKVWFKLLLGSLLGAGLGFFLPNSGGALVEGLAWAETLVIRIGRYGTLPLMVFSLTIAVYELREEKRLWSLILRTLPIILGLAALVIGAGILSALWFPPDRIRVSTGVQLERISLNIADSALELFPSNMFAPLAGEGVYLLPAYVFALFMGIGLSSGRSYSKQLVSLGDSLSRTFYHITTFISEVLGLVMIVLGAYWAVRFREPFREEGFRGLILHLGLFSAFFGFILLPLLFCLIRPRVNPWAALYGSLGPAVAGFFSGDINFTLPVLLRHVKENLGVRRRSNAVTLGLASVFGRAGSAMTAAVGFIVIIKSYSSLGITPVELLSIGLRALLVSFLLARHPGNGAYTALATLCAWYDRGPEAGYLILKPLAFYLAAIGTFLDALIASFVSLAAARLCGFQEDKALKHFI